MQMLAGAASGLHRVLAEALKTDFASPAQRGRLVGLFETIVGSTFIVGPAALAWVGPTSPTALWLAIGFILANLLWTLVESSMPTAADAKTSLVGIRGVRHALARHPIIMLAGVMGGLFVSGAGNYGVTLVNGTVLLVLTYAFRGMVASNSSSLLLRWIPMYELLALLAGVASLGSVALFPASRRARPA